MPSSSVTLSQTDIDLSKLDRESVLGGVDDVVQILYTQHDIKFAVAVLHAFEKFQDISGFARAKLLWGAQKWFTSTRQRGNFYEKFGLSDTNERTYADRLIRLWDCIETGKIPKSLHKNRKIRELLPISEALSQGFAISDKAWKQLEQATDLMEIGNILQKIKGKQPRKGTLTLTIDDRGFITAWEDGQAHHVGTLNYADMDTDEVVKKAVLRIKGGKAQIKDEK